MKVNLTTDTIILLKNIGFATGNEKPFSLFVSSSFVHFGWNEDESTLKTQVLYNRADLNGNSTCSLISTRDIPIATV